MIIFRGNVGHINYSSFFKWTKLVTLEINSFDLQLTVKRSRSKYFEIP